MIGRLRGIIVEKQPPQILIESCGVGYEVHLPMTCFYQLPDLNQETVIFTHFVVREDAQLLFGFNSKSERTLFRELIKVNGIGPKLALAILSGMSAQQFVSCVEQGEVAMLLKLPGVGKKMAERLLVEMKDRCKGLHTNLFGNAADTISATDFNSSAAQTEATAALVALGYKPQEANRMINRAGPADADCETLIREALRTVI